jgi:hypothetical protein
MKIRRMKEPIEEKTKNNTKGKKKIDTDESYQPKASGTSGMKSPSMTV